MTSDPIAILSDLLVLQAQGGDRKAMSALVELWVPRLTRRAMRLTRCHDGAQEVLQESWIGIAKGLRSLRDPALFGPWAYRIVHHKAADWIKEQSRNRSHASDLRDHASSPSDDSSGPNPSQSIRDAISRLDPKLREVVYLFYMDHCTTRQIAILLTIPEGTVKTRLSSARALLKPMLERSTQ